MLKYRCCNISLQPSMDKSQLRTDHIKGIKGDWGGTGRKPKFEKLFEKWVGPRQFRFKWRQSHSCPSLCSPWCSDHTQPVQSWSIWNSFVLGWIKAHSSSRSDPVSAHTEGRRRTRWDGEREQEQDNESSALDWLKVLWNCTFREKEFERSAGRKGLWTKDYTQLSSWKQDLLYPWGLTNFTAYLNWFPLIRWARVFISSWNPLGATFLLVLKLSSEVWWSRNL